MNKTLIIVPNIFYVNYFLENQNQFDTIFYDYEKIFYKNKSLNLFCFKKFAYLFSILKIIMDFFIFFKVFNIVFKNNKFDQIVVEGIYPTLYLHIFKFVKSKKFDYIYWCSDFLISNKYKFKHLISNLANNIVFPKLDIFFINKSKVAICSSRFIIKKKKKFYNSNLKKNIFYIPFPYISNKVEIKKNNNINFVFTFFGILRDTISYKKFIFNSNELLSNGLTKKKIIINFLGPVNQNVKELQNYCYQNNFNNVYFHGYLKNHQIDQMIKNSCVGLFLQDRTYHSSFVIPSKVFKYFEYNIPIFTTPFNYEINSIFIQNKIGVISNNFIDFKSEIMDILTNYRKYFDNLSKFNSKQKDFNYMLKCI